MPPTTAGSCAGVHRCSWQPRDDLAELRAESRRLEEENARRARPIGAGERIDPNQAPEAELDRLPGIGSATARAIVEAREREGPFARPEDLLRVRGVGPATLERMRPHLAVPAHVAVPVIGGAPGPPLAPAAPLDLL